MSDGEPTAPDTTAVADVAWLVSRALPPGDVGNGWVVHRVERLEGGSRFAVITSPTPLRVIVEVPRAGNRYHAQSERLGIWVDAAGDSTMHRRDQEIARVIADRIRDVERTGASQVPTTKLSREPSTKPTLYLTPGHLGDPDDLSLRALQVLAAVPLIFVAKGKTEEVRALLVRFNLRPAAGPDAPEIVELDDDDARRAIAVERWRQAVASGLDACVFGNHECISGFANPGKALVMAAAEMRDAVRVQSVGGASALGQALMRLPSRLEAFEFCGLLHDQSDANRLRESLLRFRVPLVAFSHGAAVREYLPRIIWNTRLRRGVIHLLTASTDDDEQMHVVTAPSFVVPSADVLREHAPVVIVIEADWMRKDPKSTRIQRVLAWMRRR